MKKLLPVGRGRRPNVYPVPSITVRHLETDFRGRGYWRGYLSLYGQAVTLMGVTPGDRVMVSISGQNVGIQKDGEGFKVLMNAVGATSCYLTSPRLTSIPEGFYTYTGTERGVYWFKKATL
ncbi:MAG: hypothetical protein WC871_03545 [Bacteroidales bacterium]|jgi:hypothetical protein